MFGRARNGSHLRLEQLPRVTKPALERSFGDRERSGQLAVGHPLPVRQLQRDLEVEGNSSQRAKQEAFLLSSGNDVGRLDPHVDEGAVDHPFATTRSSAATTVIHQLVAGNAEQVRAKARRRSEPLARLETPEKGLLDEVVDLRTDLVGEEAMNGGEVTLEQLAARLRITGRPSPDQLRFVAHRGEGSIAHCTMAQPSAPTTAFEAERSRLEARRRLFGERRALTVGGFEVERPIGSGATGTVYRARDPTLDRAVAVKLVHPQLSAERHRKRVLREARALARLQHPNVVGVLATGVHDGRIYIAMELVDGGTVTSWLAAGERSWREIINVFDQAAAGLAAAHDVGLVHRDFKPDNALVGRDGLVKLVDFGLVLEAGSAEPASGGEARALAPSSITVTGAVLGTPAYMAPEQLDRRTPVTPAADQFAFCVALYEALFGSRPFGGETLEEIAAALNRETPMPELDRVPRAVWAVIRRGLQRDPAARWPSMTKVRAALSSAASASSRWRPLAYASVAVAALGLVALTEDSHDPCDQASERIAAAWNDARRATIQEHLPDSMIADLDEYASTWARAFEATCRNHGGPAYDERMACLDHRRTQLAAAVRGIEGTADRWWRAATVLAELPSIDGCLDDTPPDVLAVPHDERRNAVEAARSRRAEAAALHRAGRLPEAVSLIEQVVAQSRATGFPPLVAEALRTQGAILLAAADYDASAAAFEESYHVASGSGDDAVAAASAVELAFLHEVHRGDSALADEWTRHARAAVERADSARALLVRHEGALALVRGDYDTARTKFEDALVRHDATPGAPRSERIVLLSNLAAAAYYVGDFDAAERHYTQALELTSEVLGADHPDVADALAGIGIVRLADEDYDGAIESHRRVVVIVRDAFGPDHPRLARALHNLGTALQRAGQLEEAEQVGRRSLEILIDVHGADHPSLAPSYAALGNLAWRQDDAELAREHHERAIAIRTAAGMPDHAEAMRSLAVLAEIDRSLGDDAAALEKIERVLAVWRPLLGPDHPDVIEAMALRAAVTPSDFTGEQAPW